MKDKKDESKKEPEIDFESKYYQAMKENVLMKDKKISFEFNESEINYLREIMYLELKELKFDIPFEYDDEDREEERKLGKNKIKKDEFLNQMIDEKRLLIETIVKKLRFEL